MSYLDEMFGLKGKTAVITGGGGVIAGAIAETLLNAGANVSLWDIKKEFSDAGVDRLVAGTEFSGNLQGLGVDTSSESSVADSIAKVNDKFGSLDILINAAGGNRGKSPFIETDIESFEYVLKLNLIAGLMVPTKIVADYWIKNSIKGNIINLASMASYIPLSGVWAYGAAKAAVINLTMGASKEFAEHGIRVNAIAPGFFVGKQNKALLFDEKSGELTPRGHDIINHTPFGRFGEVKELQGTLLYLVNDAAAGFVTGVTVPVDGGYLIDNI